MSYLQTKALPILLLEKSLFVQESYARILLRRPTAAEIENLNDFSWENRIKHLEKLVGSDEAKMLNVRVEGIRNGQLIEPLIKIPVIGTMSRKIVSYYFYANAHGINRLASRFLKSKKKINKIKRFIIKSSHTE